MKKYAVKKIYYKDLFIFFFVFFLGMNVSHSQEFYSYKYPSWFNDAKLGIMIHYGLYSVPSYSDKEQYAEWFYKGLISNDTNRIRFQEKVYGKNFNYFDYMSLFKAELFDADAWATLFKKSGAKYILFSSKHHDGFCLYDSKYTLYNSMRSAAQRDFCKELSTATRKQGLRFGLYYSLMEWTNPLFRWTIDTVGIEKYVSNHLLPQFKEIVDKYKPSIVFADGDWDFSYKTLKSEEMVQYLYDKVGKDEVIINDRWGQGFNYGYKTPEYSSGIKEQTRPWSECRSLSRSFGLNRNSPIEDYMTSEDLIHHFVELVSLGGGLMLNVSPSCDGQIPLIQQERLLDLGNWLKINGEAIYKSRPYTKAFENEDMIQLRQDSVIDFDWVRNAPMKGVDEDNFSIDWHSVFTPKETNTYTIYIDADDEAALEIEDKDKDRKVFCSTAKKDSSIVKKVRLKKNHTYNFNLYYKEIDVNASCHLYWESKTMSKQPIRLDSVFYGEVYWQEPSICYTTNNNNLYAILLNKPNSTVELLLDKSPETNTKIYLLGNEDQDLEWTYKDGKLTINLSSIACSDIKTSYAYTICIKDYLKNK
jgi:alpha-L-fucosidase